MELGTHVVDRLHLLVYRLYAIRVEFGAISQQFFSPVFIFVTPIYGRPPPGRRAVCRTKGGQAPFDLVPFAGPGGR